MYRYLQFQGKSGKSIPSYDSSSLEWSGSLRSRMVSRSFLSGSSGRDGTSGAASPSEGTWKNIVISAMVHNKTVVEEEIIYRCVFWIFRYLLNPHFQNTLQNSSSNYNIIRGNLQVKMKFSQRSTAAVNRFKLTCRLHFCVFIKWLLDGSFTGISSTSVTNIIFISRLNCNIHIR